MALIHKTKVTHYLAASPSHLTEFFSTLTQMYEEQVHTDLHLVSSDGTMFGIHKVCTVYQVVVGAELVHAHVCLSGSNIILEASI